MQADTPSLLVIAALVCAASLASYGLGISPLLRRHRPGATVAFVVGTALLLTAATLLVTSTSRWASLWPGNADDAAASLDLPHSSASFPQSNASFVKPEEAPSAMEATQLVRSTLGNGARPSAQREPVLEHERAELQRSQRSTPAAQPHMRRSIDDSAARLISLRSLGPWSATTCVLALQPDPAEPTRWWLENECRVPVAIVIATCDRHCTTWQYSSDVLLLPAKAQRSITYAEQTVIGGRIRYAACAIATASIVDRIGRMQLRPADALDMTDNECIARVVGAQSSGRHSGRSIEALLGAVPGRTRP